jgi:hypothetical protein
LRRKAVAAAVVAGVATAGVVSLGLHDPTRCHARGALPDPGCTPGIVLTTDAYAVCTPGYSASVRNVPTAVKLAVRRSYGAPLHPAAGTYEVDHLVSLELGGSNDAHNLWPEPAPGFHVKDGVENRLHALVCSGKMTLVEAQSRIAGNWQTAVR